VVQLVDHWTVDPALFGVALAAQLASAWFVIGGRADRVKLANSVTLALMLLVVARFAAQGAHVLYTFGHIAGAVARKSISESVLLLPWLLAWPAWQSAPWRRSDAWVLLGLLPLLGILRGYPEIVDGWDEEKAQSAALDIADALRGRGEGAVTFPELPEGLLVLLTPFSAGVPKDTLCASPETLAEVAASLPPPAAGETVLVDVAARRLPMGWLVQGTDAGDVGCPKSPRSRKPNRVPVYPGWSVDYAELGGLRFRSAAANPGAARVVQQGWTQAPELSEAALEDAARAGAKHLMHGMSPEGKFTYLVKGPSGKAGPGYNFPRHAGTSWFLARAGAALDDAEIRAAADRAITWMGERGGVASDGRRWVEDPSRKDGRAWIGTTALAVMAGVTQGGHGDLLDGWVQQLIGSVDEGGHVCGEMLVSDTSFDCAGTSAYGQGQTMLGLAIALRGMGDAVPDGTGAALDRTLKYLGDGTYVGSAEPHVVGDEHWMCLVAHALNDVRSPQHPGVRAAHTICEAYLRDSATFEPSRDGVRPHGASGGGVNEAISAHAWDTGSDKWRSMALAWADGFLALQYQPSDAPLLGGPEALVGGFRSTMNELDVQIDTVQHVGCSLLTSLALLRGEAGPGLLP
jgi:hypothetical protein